MSFSPTILVVDVTVDPVVEAAWNQWYDTEHLPEIASCPGFRSGQRYCTQDADGTRRYLTIYELDGPEALESPAFRSRRGWGPFADKVRFRTQCFSRTSPTTTRQS